MVRKWNRLARSARQTLEGTTTAARSKLRRQLPHSGAACCCAMLHDRSAATLQTDLYVQARVVRQARKLLRRELAGHLHEHALAGGDADAVSNMPDVRLRPQPHLHLRVCCVDVHLVVQQELTLRQLSTVADDLFQSWSPACAIPVVHVELGTGSVCDQLLP